MKYFTLLSLLLLTLYQTPPASAHAVVTNHSLKLAPIYPNHPDKVELIFNSKIEPGLSQVFLVRTGDKQEPLAFTKGQQQGQILIDIPALSPGKYALNFKIFAQDGHLTEDVIHFTVAPLKTELNIQKPTQTK